MLLPYCSPEKPCHACQARNPGDVQKVEPGLPSTEPLCPLGARTGNRPELSPERKLGILRLVWHSEYLIPCPLLPTPAEDQDSVWGARDAAMEQETEKVEPKVIPLSTLDTPSELPTPGLLILLSRLSAPEFLYSKNSGAANLVEIRD